MSENMYTLTNPQKSIWLTEQFYKGTSIENITGSVNVLQNVDFGILKKAINLFVKKNDSFRLKFTLKNGNAMQYVDKFTEFDIEIISVETDNDVKRIERKMCDTPFDTLENFLFDFKLFKFPDGHGGFIINAHHLISDAWTAGLVVNEIMDNYEALIKNEEISNEPNPSYIEYINSETEYLNSENFKKDKVFWNELFETIPEAATIPSIKEDTSKKVNCASKRKLFTIPKETIDLINSFCKTRKASAFNFFIGVLSIYLSRVSGLNEFVIGTPILNRGNFKEKQTSGMYISTIPFKVSINPENLFSDFLSNISVDFLKIFRHQKYPYQYLLEDLRIKDNSIPNLYNVLISYQNVRSNKQTSNIPYDAKWIGNNNISDDIDIHLYDMNDTGSMNIAYDYLLSKYTIDDICSIHARILHIINQILENKNIKLKDIEIVTPDEKRKILYDFNNTKVDYPKDKTITQLFEEQVEKTPDNIALVFENQQLTYKELNEKSNSLAYYLRNKGIGRNDIVGIMVNRSLEMIVSILAVLKSGACYIPIDPEYPQDRIEYMLDNSNAKMLLTFTKLDDKVNFNNKAFVELKNELYNSHKSNLENINKPDDLAYIIYTSGSTGKPKGVMLIHKSLSNLTNYCNHYVQYLKENKYRTIVSVTTVSFDIFIFETLISLQKGLKLVIANEEEQTIPRLLSNLIEKNNIEIIQTTPSRMQLLVNNINDILNLSKLKFITLAGEQLPISLVNDLKKIGSPVIYNGYGPSETTVFSSLTDVTNYKSITIGHPIDNTQIYILNSSLNICPIEVPGEIYIAGDGVGHGYINNEDLTKKNYLPNVFSKENKVLYKTGDLGFYRPNGEIMCLGRCDNQVKIRGLRIELEEIENEILNFDNIDNCVVVKKVSNDNHEFLCAYFTSYNEINVNNIRNSLQKRLPKYMVPQYFVKLTELPYTPNGKIDRKKLPMPNIETVNKELVLPRNNIDEILVSLLKEMLHIKNISINDSFFELGGDSLTAINLSTRIYSEFNVQIFVKDILENPIVKDLSDLIASKDAKNSKISILKADNAKYYVASSAQARTYYASNIAGNNSNLYNITGGLILDKSPDIKKLENAFIKLIDRQASLRTYFDIEYQQVVQKIKDNVEFKLETGSTVIKDNEIKSFFEDFVKPFDLSKAPLFRAKIVKMENEKVLLAIDMHHIISDGTSLSVLVNDVCKIYNNEELNELKIDYKDYAVWEHNRLKNGDFKEAENYWLNQFKGEIPVLNLPTKPRSVVQSFEGDKIYTEINKTNTEKIDTLSKDLGVTPYMILLSVYYILLSKYTSQDDIVIGTPIVNRTSSALYDIVGMFVNSLPFRANIDSNLSFKDFVNHIKDMCLENYKYQNYPFDELVNKLKLTRDTSRSPLFDTMFIYQNNGYTPISFDGIKAEYYIPNTKISKFDLSLEIVPADNMLNLSFEYATKLFDKGFIRNLSNHYINILNAILENKDIKIADICMLSEDEKNKILYDFNNTKVDYPKDKTIAQLFEEQVEKTPNNVAVVFETQQLTYRELNEKANSLAHYLRDNGIGRNDIVGIMVNRSLEMIVSILAVLKSGAAYLPIDISYPKNRIKYMINDSNLKLILTQNDVKKYFEDLPNSLSVDLNNSDIYSKSNNNLNTINAPDDLAYLIYTSGSTGNPKGVMLTQKNVNNFIKGACDIIEFKETIVSVTTMCFDIFVLETLLPLQNGLKIIIANETEQNIPKSLNKLCIENDVKMLQTTPSKMSLLLSDSNNLDYIKNLSTIMLGGEPFPYKLLQQLKSITDSKIYNMYGPTETTVWSSIKDLSKINSISIGKPIANTQMYILDSELNILPVGIPGELYIGGDGVSKGYFNRPKLTSEKFIANKYIENDIIYNTGDIAKWLPNGEIDCLGRSDSQVKLKGLRIELGEIEEQILSFPNIDNSVACIKTDVAGRQFLCAYFTSKERISISQLKNFLSKFLPNYMVPSFLMQLEKFKYTPNGKIDKNLLPKPNISSNSNIILPETEIEHKLSKIWEDLLCVSPISIDENFFNIGGDSILALKMQIELLNNNINISYADIFKYNTIKELALRIDSINTTSTENYYKDYDFTKINDLLKNNNLNNVKKIQKKKIRNVLLTGATGFLGAHILDYLLSNTSSNVYCIIRKDVNSSASTTDKLISKLHYYFENKYDQLLNKRLFIITSDITLNNLGLTDSQMEDLANNISCVINSAAIVKHYGYYSEFEKINVIGVKNLIDFCKKYNKKLIQISTISVSGNTLTDLGIQENVFDKDVNFTEKNLYINQSLDNVYVRSKFEAEKIILENIIDSSLDALILRVGNITSRVSDGKFQPNANDNAFLNRLKAFIELKVIPDYILDDYVEFSPVDRLAEAIIKSIEFAPSSISVLHLYNQNHVYIHNLIKMLPKNLIKVIPNEDFKNILNKNLQISTNKDIISHITNDLNKNKELIYKSHIKIKNDISNTFLKNIKYKWNKINKKYIDNLLNIL